MTGRKRPNDPSADPTYARLRRELGFDDLNAEQLFRVLFGDAFDLSRSDEAKGPVRVDQIVDEVVDARRRRRAPK